ncbi:hypothetical protein P691DRAFT_686797, partial [Macrolepiota fuliginosa MF-IS2]
QWSSTHLMVECALQNRLAIDTFVLQTEELHKYMLTEHDWQVLKDYSNILVVPHAFQQRLSFEKTPILGNAFPSFYSLIKKWESLQLLMPTYAIVIGSGLQKIQDYYERMLYIDTYTLTICQYH